MAGSSCRRSRKGQLLLLALLGAGVILSNEAAAQIEPILVQGGSETSAAVSSFGGSRTQERASGMADAPPENEAPSPADRALEDRVVVRLASVEALSGSDLEVRAEGHRVTLAGTVATEWAREVADRTAKATPGVRDVENRLAIRGPPERSSIADEDLASNVTYLLGVAFPASRAGADPISGWLVGGEGWEFLVEVYRGDVMLHGNVPTGADVRRAVETAWRVPGVRRVYSDLVAAGDAVQPYVAGH